MACTRHGNSLLQRTDTPACNAFYPHECGQDKRNNGFPAQPNTYVRLYHYGFIESVVEEDLEFIEKSKTDFALNLICNNPNYSIPQYIKNGLIWLNQQRVLE